MLRINSVKPNPVQMHIAVRRRRARALGGGLRELRELEAEVQITSGRYPKPIQEGSSSWKPWEGQPDGFRGYKSPGKGVVQEF
jgi:hypothetical protein